MKKNLNKEILKLAIPNILSNVSVPLLSTVDTALMGHLSAVLLGAVGIGSMIFNFIYWNFGFLRMGSTGMTAQAYGAGDEKELSAILARVLSLAMLISIVILISQYELLRGGLYLMNVPEHSMGYVTEYFLIRIWAAPATFALYGIFGWLFGMQNAIYPLILTIFINVINIVVSTYLVVYVGWDVAGVALGTVIAQYAGLALAMVLLIYKYKKYLDGIHVAGIRNVSKMKAFFSINKDIFLRTICLTIAFGFFYSQSAKMGTIVLAVNVIMLQLLNWMSYGIDGFAFAAESLVGKYKGANDDDSLRKGIRLSFIWGALLAVLYSFTYFIFDNQIATLYSADNEIVQYTIQIMYWMVLLPIVSFASYIWDGIYIGLTASKAMLHSMLISFAIYFITYYSLQDWNQEYALWIALLVFLGARGIIQTLLFLRRGIALK